MCGAGVLPARMAAVARRQGWRVVAFTFGDAPGVAVHAECLIPSRVNEAGAVLAALQQERIGAVLFSGKFWMRDFLHGATPDAALAEITARAGAMVDTNLVDAVVATLGRMDIALLDQRPFLGDWLGARGCWSAREPTAAEWSDVRRGLEIARIVAAAGVGQTVVVKRGRSAGAPRTPARAPWWSRQSPASTTIDSTRRPWGRTRSRPRSPAGRRPSPWRRSAC
jgi:DUF1009 family protein